MTGVRARRLGALLLLPWLTAAAPAATPVGMPTPGPRASAAPTGPCGYVDFIAAGAPRTVNGTTYERIKAIVSFADGHTETAEFPYYWVYPNGELTDPWSATNLRRADFAITMQMPPPGTDVTTFPVLIQYVLKHSDANGYTDLRPCSMRHSIDEALGRVPSPSPASQTATWTTFVDDTPRNAPVTVVEANLFNGSNGYDVSRGIVRECVTFWNRSAQTVAAVRVTFTYFDAAGKLKRIEPMDRFGSFAPGAVVEGVRRGQTSRADFEKLKNCRIFGLSGELGVNHVAVTAVEFTDHSTWPPGSPSVWPAAPQ